MTLKRYDVVDNLNCSIAHVTLWVEESVDDSPVYHVNSYFTDWYDDLYGQSHAVTYAYDWDFTDSIEALTRFEIEKRQMRISYR